MTTEEVIKHIRDKDLLSSEEAKEVFRALGLIQEQNTKLEKIKKEIKDLHNSHMIHFIDADDAVDTCLDIIDKYI